MLAIMNNEKTVGQYVGQELLEVIDIRKKAFELFELNVKRKHENIAEVIQMLTEMYTDFCWTCGFADGEVAIMDIELEQFINESIELLQF